ncbi:UvrD-helicase domain-containing protein [Brevibacillus agri]|uniref:UvrD-helicase domain-containing protein n=1 Tax=Brevibacillus TaxID=55080 RepID=UPI002E1ECAA4|nr:UvrD-helicase domain-containing protein [Brevibacillus borstelensis]MED1850067.1 UvrD-helicase domain-containing protein [Brevibacillus borstelensis]
MFGWIIKITRYFQKQKALKLIHKIEMYLLQIQEKYKKIAFEINQVTVDRYVPNSYFQELLKRCDIDRSYLEGDSPFRITPGIEQQYNKLAPSIATLPQYDEICRLHVSIRNQSQVQYGNIQARAAQMTKQVQQINVKVQHFFEELEKLKQDYISESTKNIFVARHKEPSLFYKNAAISEIEDPTARSYLTMINDFDKHVISWNQEYLQRELLNNKEFFDDIDGKSLDEQQRVAVLTDEDNNLVLAGAGSGKTLTISGKVKFLTEKRGVLPDEILLISFTNKAAEEMYERIAQRLGVKVDVKTFHKLGMGIIARHSDAKPDVLNDSKSIIQEYFRSVIYTNQKELEKIVTFFGVYLNIPKDLEQFDSLGELHENQKSLDFETLKGKLQRVTKNLQTFKGETMKSLEETLIANFLFLNGIEYIYENDYEYPTASKYYRQYKPDFYLPDYGIYIEHFGITEDFRTTWLSSIEEEKYLQGIHWKRALHKEKNTVLIESYSYYNKNGVLFEKLEENLRKHGVQFKKIDVKAVYEAICIKEKDYYFEEFIKLVGSFINLFKSNGYKKEQFSQFAEENQRLFGYNTFLKTRNQIFLSLAEPIYEYYQETLRKQNKIDFNDMINIATDIAKGKSATFHYKYIIIDEYQDISLSRYQLIKTIKDKTNAKVVCVGDDWQSIYRFAGSDVQLFTKFGDYFGKYELLRIERTYRNSQQLINIAGNFVMKNKNQFRKNLVSNKENSQPIRVIGYTQNMVEVTKAVLDEIIETGGQDQTIMLLGRNNFDINFLKDQADFRVIESEKVIKVEYKKHKSAKISFMSTHKSKGLEADQVILINAKNSLLGFPNRISDDPVLSWVLKDQDAFEFAEERRLFYVALTRTKNNLYILAPEKDSSIFVKELIKDHGITFETTFIQNSIANNPACLKCKTGLLVERKNQINQKSFLGCSNYPQCNQTYSDVRLLNNQVICNRCNGYMVRRMSKNGEFYGCSNFPHCRNTINIGNFYNRVKQIR